MDTLEIAELDGERGLRLAGELDMQTAPQLREALANMQGSGQTRLDVTGLTFIDSFGLHTIATYVQSRNGTGPLILEGVSATMLRLFEITQLAQHPMLEIRLDGDDE
jgi:anti-anti-sigma factor